LRLWEVVGSLVLVLWAGVAWFAISSDRKSTGSDRLPEIAIAEDTDLIYDASQLQPDQSRLFTYPLTSSERVRLLVTRDSKGTARAAFASCTACYRFRSQHYLKEGRLICGQCQQTMRVGDAGERLTGKSCVAVPISFSITDNKILIRAEAIADGIKVFAAGTRLEKRD
jgi:uncharacterized membrane protein